MTRMQQLHSGLVVPAEKQKPTKPRGPLEFTGDARDVRDALRVLWNATRAGGIELEPRTTSKARRSVVRLAMDLLLGPDSEFEELC